MPTPVYIDNHATTRVDPRVVQAMLPYFDTEYANPGSTGHELGISVRDAVEQARRVIAESIGGAPREIVFTSGATESNNLAIRGITDHPRRQGNHIVSSPTEHPAILDPLTRLEKRGFQVTLVAPKRVHEKDAGWIDPQAIADAITPQTCLVTIMLANNEIGTIQSIADIAQICKSKNVPFHTDATQAVGKIAVDVQQLDVDLMSFSAHKMYGPKGVGALLVRRRTPQVRLAALFDGGGQERGMRSGTLNVHGIIGFAKALELCVAELSTESERIGDLRDQLFHGLTETIDGVTLNGPNLKPRAGRLFNNLNVQFENVDGQTLMMHMRDLAVSSGSACTSAQPLPSHVLQAIGLNEDQSRSSLRFGLGRFNTAEHIEFAIETVAAAVDRVRGMAP